MSDELQIVWKQSCPT